MKQYLSILGPNKAPKLPCLAFNKLDGSNIRAEWTRKQGWFKFGSKSVLLDASAPLGGAIQVFLDTYGDSLPEVFKKDKHFRGIQKVTVFCEYVGPSSFAGLHEESEVDQMETVLLDVNLHKKGLLVPRDFIRFFEHVKIPEVVYEGNFGPEFIQDVKDGKYPVGEGVVAKGVRPGKGSASHHIWMAKVKTRDWLERLKQRAEMQPGLRQVLAENIVEQS